jgi:hypothetical protein
VHTKTHTPGSKFAAWAPFPSRADFEITELAIRATLNANQKQDLLKGIQSERDTDPLASPSYQAPYVWSKSETLGSISSVREMDTLMEKARRYTIQACTISLLSQ